VDEEENTSSNNRSNKAIEEGSKKRGEWEENRSREGERKKN
jgi:hypothetical protein